MDRSIYNDPEFPSVNKDVEVNDFVVNKTHRGPIVPMSVGVVRSIDGTNAEVFFVGKAMLLQIALSDLIVIDIYQTGKKQGTNIPPFKFKICNICHVLKIQALGLLVKIVHKSGAVFDYWSKLVHKCGCLPAFSTCI